MGLCGGYNARLAAATAERRAALGERPTLCVGRRAGTYLARREVAMERIYAGPASVRGIADLLLRLAQDMLGAYRQRRLSRFEVVSNGFEGAGADRPVMTTLLPDRIERSDVVMARYASRETVTAVGVRELLYISMHRLLREALVSEHGVRLAATQSAAPWLEERTSRLRRRLRASRREAGAQETLEISNGARARSGARRGIVDGAAAG